MIYGLPYMSNIYVYIPTYQMINHSPNLSNINIHIYRRGEISASNSRLIESPTPGILSRHSVYIIWAYGTGLAHKTTGNQCLLGSQSQHNNAVESVVAVSSVAKSIFPSELGGPR